MMLQTGYIAQDAIRVFKSALVIGDGIYMGFEAVKNKLQTTKVEEIEQFYNKIFSNF